MRRSHQSIRRQSASRGVDPPSRRTLREWLRSRPIAPRTQQTRQSRRSREDFEVGLRREADRFAAAVALSVRLCLSRGDRSRPAFHSATIEIFRHRLAPAAIRSGFGRKRCKCSANLAPLRPCVSQRAFRRGEGAPTDQCPGVWAERWRTGVAGRHPPATFRHGARPP